MPRCILYLAIIIFGLSCQEHSSTLTTREGKHTIAILPFTGTDKKLAATIKDELERKLFAAITILDETDLPASAFYSPRNRYLADSLLVFLENYNRERFEKIIGITSVDISTKKGEHLNWGVMGLGQLAGRACVVSSYRPLKSAFNHNQFQERMTILCLHELGHTYSIPHCNNVPCIMKDAEGKMNLDDANSYCTRCNAILVSKKIIQNN